MSDLKNVFSGTKEIIIGEKKFNITPATLGDLSSFQKWCDKKKQDSALDLYIRAGQTPNIKDILAITGNDAEYEVMMGSLEGVVHLVYKSIIKNNKEVDVTEDEVADSLKIDQLQEIVEFIFGSFITKDEGDNKPKNTEAKPQSKE